MQHRVIAPAIATLAALIVAGGFPSLASAADPSGIWAKDDGSAKMQVSKCGRGICSKIVWLQNPKDSRGKPLADGRNENVSLRSRPIVGLSLFSKMAPKAPNVWVGSVYNPEEGRIYNDVTVTLASSRQIVLRGCKGWLLCGEKTWTKSKLDKSLVEPEETAGEELIEVKAPKKEPKPEQEIIEASVAPAAPSEAESREDTETAAREDTETSGDSDIAFAAESPVAPGTITIEPGMAPLALSGETVSSLLVMTEPRAKSSEEAPIVEASLTEGGAAPSRSGSEDMAAIADAPEEAAPPRKAKPKVAATKPKASPKMVTRASTADAPSPARKKVKQAQEERERLPWEMPR